jgi:hypothetical protein
MITAAELAGYFAAHAIWSVSESDGLIPMLAFTDENDEKKMERLVTDDAAAAVESGRQKLESNEMDATDAALVYDGRIPVDGEKMDAIIIEMCAYFSPGSKAILAVPYSPVSSGKFTVYKPKLIGWENCEDFDQQDVIESFWNGVDAHEQGVKVWHEHLDQSK